MIVMEPVTYIACGAILVSGFLVFWHLATTKKLREEIAKLKHDQAVVNSASFGMARQLRQVQIDISQRRGTKAGYDFSLSDADNLVDQGVGVSRLADELGVSQTEAEIITHLRPIRNRAPAAY